MARKKKTDFYNLDRILAKNAQYNIIYGERANGKTYAVKYYALERFRDYGEEFMFVKRYDRDISVNLVTQYLSDTPISEIFGDKFNYCYPYGGNIYLCNLNPDTGRKENITKCGYYRSISNAQRYSSTQYPNVNNIILEEFAAINGEYLPNELFLFQHIISTVARRRDIKVFLIGNTISRLCPYWAEYGVEEIIEKQNQNTIAVVERETDGGKQLVAVEYCGNTSGRSKMFAGIKSEMINEGKWLSDNYPKLPFPRELAECFYTVILQYTNKLFLIEFLIFEGNVCAYITPKTTPIKAGSRVISDTVNLDKNYTLGFTALVPKERELFAILFSKSFYANNLCGTEFNTAIKNIKGSI